MTLLYLLSFAFFVAYSGDSARQISRRSLSEWLLLSFLFFAASVILTGFILSALDLTATSPAWAGSVFVTATVLRLALVRITPQAQPWALGELLGDRRRTFAAWFSGLSGFLKGVFGLLFLTLGLIAVTNTLLVLFTVPNEWDSMTGHLNRVMQYLQRGSMAHFGGTNWNMDTYPKSVCTLQIYAYLMTGGFENAFKFIHFASYWMAALAVFGITQRLTRSLSASFFAGLAYALLPNVLMQSITTETDIVLTAYFSILLYFLFTYQQTRDNRYLHLAGMAFAVAYGHKVTFTLMLPSVFVIMIYTVFLAPNFGETVRRTVRLGVAIGLAMCLWTFPTGYIRNIQVFGHPIGPPTALKHQSVERAGTKKNLFIQGSRNVIRYAYDHVNLDGLRNAQFGLDANVAMRRPLVWLEDKLNLRLDEKTEFSIVPFTFNRRFEFYNANPYWGIFGFGLVWPLLFLTLLGVVRSRAHVFIGIAVLLHFAALSYSAAYDPFKGRYFISTGLMGALFLGLLFSNRRVDVSLPGRTLGKAWLGLVVVIGSLSALLAVFLNERCLPFSAYGRPSAFRAERIYQMTLFRPDTYVPYKRFDEMVPDSATVALGTINDDFEYPLYGKHLSRRLITINPFEKGVQPIPKEASYLFFSKNVIKPQPGDIRLGTDTTIKGLIVPGEDYYLRKLK
ncbi:ArnT family glycosyltransferase [Tellurirhabdus rosea]|uniref:ArnT family glycosyltransferase n=1 Tax=Tellurirhabdus rosea TaxID=2674997 RepID=UPI002253AF14|nr:glycosyltransferase family 39 protein [Tellurirhabdus rosea]